MGLAGAAASFVLCNATSTALLLAYTAARDWSRRGRADATWGGLSLEALRGWGGYLSLAVPALAAIAAEWWGGAWGEQGSWVRRGCPQLRRHAIDGGMMQGGRGPTFDPDRGHLSRPPHARSRPRLAYEVAIFASGAARQAAAAALKPALRQSPRFIG
jgi:hypothetical protein